MVNLKRTDRKISSMLHCDGLCFLFQSYELCNILCVPIPSRKSLRIIRVIHFISNPVICRKSALNASTFCCIVALFFEISSRNAFTRAIVNPVLVWDNLFFNNQKARSAKSFPTNLPDLGSLKCDFYISERKLYKEKEYRLLCSYVHIKQLLVQGFLNFFFNIFCTYIRLVKNK